MMFDLTVKEMNASVERGGEGGEGGRPLRLWLRLTPGKTGTVLSHGQVAALNGNFTLMRGEGESEPGILNN